MILSLAMTFAALGRTPLIAHEAPIHSEKAYLEYKGRLNLCAHPQNEPLETITPQGKHLGPLAEYFDLLALRSDLHFQFIPTKNLAESIRLTQEHRCDLISSMDYRPDLSRDFFFSKPILEYPAAMLTKENNASTASLRNLKQASVGILAHHFSMEQLNRINPLLQITLFEEIPAALSALESGQIDHLIDELPRLRHVYSRERQQKLSLVELEDLSLHKSIVMRKDHPLLHSVINRAIDRVTEREKQRLFSPWLNHLPSKFQAQSLLWLLLLILVAALSITLIWIRKLKNDLVHERGIAMRAFRESHSKDSFFSMISHDLKGPIESFALLCQLVLTAQDTYHQDLLESMHKSAIHLKELLHDLLSFTRSQTGELRVQKEEFLLEDVMHRVLAHYSTMADLKKIELMLCTSGGNLVHADRSMITTVMRNLLANAIKFTRNQGKITLTIKEKKDQILIQIEDTGVGISKERQDKLFRIQGEMISTEGTQGERGTGLGLLLCKDFVERNNGQIGLESEPGQGSRFWFTLPIHQKRQEAQEELIAPDDMVTLLLVEDNQINLKLESMLLNQMGIAHHTAQDGRSALEQALAKGYRVILLDIDLPDINGVEVAEIIYQKSKHPPKIIAVSSYDPQTIEKEYGHMDFDGFLTKPLMPNQLRQSLQALKSS